MLVEMKEDHIPVATALYGFFTGTALEGFSLALLFQFFLVFI